MPELTIYDSHGKPYGEGGRGRSNDRIEEFFFGGVKLYLDAGSRTELVVFFRARESNVGRAEQFYAVYTTRNTRNLFENFKSDLRQRVETEYGMSIDTTSDDVQVYEALGGRNDAVPGSEFDRSVVSKLLQSGNRLRVGVSTASGALGLCSKYLQESANRVAIADNTSIDALESCDLAVEIGTHRGLEPLGETSRLMDEQRRRMEGQLIDEKVTTIKQEVDDLRTKTSKSDEQIRNRLKRQISIFETPPPSSTGGRFDALPELSRPQKLGGAVGLVVLIVLVSVVASGLLGIGPVADTLVFGDDESEATLEKLSVAGTALESDSTQNVSLSDGNLTVTGETDQETVMVTFEPDDGNMTENRSGVDNDSFDVTLTGLEAGSGTLTIKAGSTDDDTFESGNTKSFDVELVADSEPRLEALRVAETSFDELDANETVSIPDGELTVSGETGHETVDVRFEPDEGDVESGSDTVENGAFTVTLTDLDSGSGTLFIDAATASEDGDIESSTNKSLELKKPSLESLTAEGTSVEQLDNGTLTLPDDGVTVSGETNQEDVRITFDSSDDSGDENATASVENGTFTETLTGLEAGSGELLVEVGTTDDDGTFESVRSDSIDLELREPMIENVSVNGESFDGLTENESISIADGELTVSGETNLETVSVVFEPDSDEQSTATDEASVDGGEFTVALSDLAAGTGELRVEAPDAFASATPEPRQIELEEPVLENLYAEEQSFADLDENTSVSIADGDLTVTGETNQEAVNVTFRSDDGTATSSHVAVDGGEFTVALSDLAAGTGELIVDAGTEGDGEDAEFESEIADSTRLELDDSS